MQAADTLVKYHGLGRHVCAITSGTVAMASSCTLTSINHTELLRIRTPCKIMNWPFLVKCDSAVKVTRCAEEIHSCLAVIALVGIVYLGLSEK